MRTTDHSVLFWGTRDIYSNWHPSPFVVDGVAYLHVEQFMMAAKARLFGDVDALERIMAASSPRYIKAFGRAVRGYDEATWVANRERIVFEGCLAKFEQNPKLSEALTFTRARTLIEASPVDAIWGIGLAEADPRAEDPAQWKGLNLLGVALMRVRHLLGERWAARMNGTAGPDVNALVRPTVRPLIVVPTEAQARTKGLERPGVPESERVLFESYMTGHCWATGPWNPETQAYDKRSTQVLLQTWADRGALSQGAGTHRPVPHEAHWMGAHGSPHMERERLAFEAYCEGRRLELDPWDSLKRCYVGMGSRMAFALWRDRAALSFGPQF